SALVVLPSLSTFAASLACYALSLHDALPILIDHRVDGVLQFQDFALHRHGDLLCQVAVGDGGGDVGDVAHLSGEVAGHEIHAIGEGIARACNSFTSFLPTALPS